MLELMLGTHDVLKLRLVIQNLLRPRLGEPACAEGYFRPQLVVKRTYLRPRLLVKSKDLRPRLWMPRLE